ncbi:hypothetical protein GBAR_LOCUS10653 [Geodia barretti]|uniref:Uncharacterized protein n=1 Tax=Geodia barretti TaxID=519541 RepID=A0AA35RWJ9_GEOBA|nr:hypothetical protein GBAR_LOCUS10653 [Geodia barretti]
MREVYRERERSTVIIERGTDNMREVGREREVLSS